MSTRHALSERQKLASLHIDPDAPYPFQTATHLIETRHGLIRTPNLHLEERRLIAITPLPGALNLSLLRIIPCSGATEHIFPLLALYVLPVVDSLVEEELIRTC
jgi:hypothetical protein